MKRSGFTDDERVALATCSGDRMLGPEEWQRCGDHPRKWVTFRWVWPTGETPSSSTPEVVRACNHPDHEDD